MRIRDAQKTVEIKCFLTTFAWLCKDSEPDPDPYLWLSDPDTDPGGPKHTDLDSEPDLQHRVKRLFGLRKYFIIGFVSQHLLFAAQILVKIVLSSVADTWHFSKDPDPRIHASD